jgi:hypothetical protein
MANPVNTPILRVGHSLLGRDLATSSVENPALCNPENSFRILGYSQKLQILVFETNPVIESILNFLEFQNQNANGIFERTTTENSAQKVAANSIEFFVELN